MSELKFRGFALAKLIRACDETSPNAIGRPYTYEIKIYPKISNGEFHFVYYSVHRVNQEFGKTFRMDPMLNQYAILRDDGRWRMISDREYCDLLREYRKA